MVYKITFEINDVEDSILIEGETIEEIKEQIKVEIFEKRNGVAFFSEKVSD
ncbi:MAG: hypothetical protein ACRC7N_21320 [Clostridium sp.]